MESVCLCNKRILGLLTYGPEFKTQTHHLLLLVQNFKTFERVFRPSNTNFLLQIIVKNALLVSCDGIQAHNLLNMSGLFCVSATSEILGNLRQFLVRNIHVERSPKFSRRSWD